VSGTSAAAPAFAGILSWLDKRWGARLGQPNYVLYRLAAMSSFSQCNASNTVSLPPTTCVFNDITVGNNSLRANPAMHFQRDLPEAEWATIRQRALARNVNTVDQFSGTTVSFIDNHSLLSNLRPLPPTAIR